MNPQTTFYLPTPYKEALMQMAEEKKITLGNAIRQAVAAYLCSTPNDSPLPMARVQEVNNKGKRLH